MTEPIYDFWEVKIAGGDKVFGGSENECRDFIARHPENAKLCLVHVQEKPEHHGEPPHD